MFEVVLTPTITQVSNYFQSVHRRQNLRVPLHLSRRGLRLVASGSLIGLLNLHQSMVSSSASMRVTFLMSLLHYFQPSSSFSSLIEVPLPCSPTSDRVAWPPALRGRRLALGGGGGLAARLASLPCPPATSPQAWPRPPGRTPRCDAVGPLAAVADPPLADPLSLPPWRFPVREREVRKKKKTHFAENPCTNLKPCA
jgi:hypothetical protein